jgi:hypothetical protein
LPKSPNIAKESKLSRVAGVSEAKPAGEILSERSESKDPCLRWSEGVGEPELVEG